jgi:putative ABC transport system ATP-binding protein
LIAQGFAGLKTDKGRVHQVMRSLNISDRLNSYPGQLSQGQLQRVSIARAMINKPAVIRMEPFSLACPVSKSKTALVFLSSRLDVGSSAI